MTTPVHVRRPVGLETALGAFTAFIAAVIALSVAYMLVVLISEGDLLPSLGGLVLSAVPALAFALVALRCLRPRLRADATGLHIRNTLRTHDVPWPARRTQLVTVPAMGFASKLGSMGVQYRPDDGSRPILIHALIRPAVLVRPAVLAVSGADADAAAEAQDLWDWGVEHGYASPAPTARELAAASRHPAHAGAGGDVAASNRTVDPSVDRLVYRAIDQMRRPLIAMSVIALIFTAGPLSNLLSTHNPVEVVGSCVGLSIGLALWLMVAVAAQARTTIDRDGFHIRSLRTSHVPWPDSRSSLFLVVSHKRRRASASGAVVGADGTTRLLTGVGAGGRNPHDILRAEALLDGIWAWGVRHGVARETGAYRQARPEIMESRRNLAAQTLAELHEQDRRSL